MFLTQSKEFVMKKIGIFGGTFDPIHYGHLYVGENARIVCDLEKVIFVPSYKPPHKQNKIITSDFLRYNMCILATKDNNSFSVSDIEIKKQGISYTYNTLKLLKKSNENNDYYFIMGADMFADFPKWYKASKILEEFKIIVFPRNGYDIHKIKQESFYMDYKDKIELLDLTTVNVSGTDLRNQLKSGYSAKYLIPDTVLEYIKAKNIYRG